MSTPDTAQAPFTPLHAGRPRRVVFVVGTGTDVGKTWLSERLLRNWRSDGLRVAARKPAQSFAPGDDTAGRTDAQLLGAASGEEPFRVCPGHRWYPVPMAPPMAAAALGRPSFAIDDLIAELGWPTGTADGRIDIGLVESAGGVRSPLADDGDSVTWCARFPPDLVILVADAGLGTINAVRLSLDAIGTAAPGQPDDTPTLPVLVFLNRFDSADELHQRNGRWLSERLGVHTVTQLDELAHLVA